ncbi:acetolactate decarboxylase [uncultured Winogradskyella sp.]|uniref:acetolactate decarboxylase n=1 Tax=uncultured Winogradskyella sp. TaxID=395353 RepID=UPI00263944FF|nr:acetolactate decarboxylase [uncultured Winogradskyella sp.]
MVFQNSTINALVEGIYKGDISFGELKEYGDFGLGTFQDLDGEMIGFDGEFYQVKSNGSIVKVSDEQLTPFSVVTKFNNKESSKISAVKNFHHLELELDKVLPSKNYIYAFRIDGFFKNIKARSVPKQETSIRLTEVAKDIKPFIKPSETRGTLVGFYFPSYMKDINVTGYHFHFLSDDKLFGGHVLDIEVLKAELIINPIYGFQMILPKDNSFKNVDLTKTTQKELDTIER